MSLKVKNPNNGKGIEMKIIMKRVSVLYYSYGEHRQVGALMMDSH